MKSSRSSSNALPKMRACLVPEFGPTRFSSRALPRKWMGRQAPIMVSGIKDAGIELALRSDLFVEREGARDHPIQSKFLARAQLGGKAQGPALIWIIQQAIEGFGQGVRIGGRHREAGLLVQGHEGDARIKSCVYNR